MDELLSTYVHAGLAPTWPGATCWTWSAVNDATWAEVRTEHTSGPLAAAGAGELAAAAGVAAGDDELAAGAELLLHAASPAAASATALMVRAGRPGAAPGAARRARESRLLAITVISPMSGLPEGKDGTRSGPVFPERRSRPARRPRSC